MGWRIAEQVRQHRIASYNKGCRCDECRAAARIARKRHRDRKKYIVYNEE